MKTKRFIVALLITCLVCAFIPCTPAYAAGNIHVHPRATFEIPIGSADALNADGDAYLTADITLTSDIVVSGSLSLCLNGFDINMGSHTITVEKGGSISIYECPHSPGGSFLIGAGDRPAFEIFGAFNVLGGNYVTQGRSVLFNRGETNISGGSFSGADAQLVQTNGCGVMVITAGKIEATGTGSAIAMIAAPEDEAAKPRDYNAVIAGGTITAESGSPGTVVVNAPKGRFVINSGANLVGHDCPAVRVEAGNFDAYGGAVVYSDSASAIVGTGGNVNLYFANITSEEKYGVDISENAELLLSGSLEIVGGNAGIRLAEGKVFSMSDYGFYGDVRVSIHTDVVPTEDNPVAISKPCEAKHYSHFLSATPSSSITYKDKIIYNSYDGTVSHSHDGRNYVLALHGSYTDLSKNNYYLEGDLSCNGFFTGSVVNICLNGHTLNLGSAIRLYPNSTLNIYDCQGSGKIQCNSTCIQDINNGGVKLVVHQGTIVSNSSAPVKLSGDDSVVVKNGKIQSLLDGSCAIEAAGPNNTVSVEGGSIEGVAAAIKAQDGSVTIDGTPEGSFSGNYIVQTGGFREGTVTVSGNPVCNSQTADILLASGKLLAAGPEIDPAAKFTVVSEAVGDMITMSGPSETDISSYFEITDETKALMCGEGNILQLARRLPASPESLEIFAGEAAEFRVEYTGTGAPVYQWYIRDLESGESRSVDGASSESFKTPSDLEDGSYELYCTVSDESGSYVGDRLKLTVKKDLIEGVSVSAASEIAHTGAPISVNLNAAASTTMGRSVSFRYSVDGINYSEELPVIGPDAGQYTIYYIASAESCDDVKGQLSVEILPGEEPEIPEAPAKAMLSPRLIAIIASSGIFLVLCVIFVIQLIRKKIED